MKCRWLPAPVLLLSACSTLHPGPPAQPAEKADERPAPVKDEQIHVELIRQMLDKEQYYAALAHIQDQQHNSGPSDELTLLEGDARRHLGQRRQAEELYRKLLAGRYAGLAYHGLGLLYAENDLNAAIGDLRHAVEQAPTNVDFRNDLGYALMQAGRYTEAMPELSTAAELAPTQLKSRNNLIILMMLMGNEAAVTRLTQQSGTTPDSLQRLRDEARSIRDKQPGGHAAGAAG